MWPMEGASPREAASTARKSTAPMPSLNKRFPRELRLDVLGNANPVQHFQHGNRVGWRDQRAEEKAFDPRSGDPKEGQSPVHDTSQSGVESSVPTTERSPTASFSRAR